MQYKYNDLVNIHKNIPALILGSSKNMINFPFDKFNGKIFSLGDAIIRGENFFHADYWIAANNEFPIPEIPFHLELINNYKNTKFFFSDTAAYNDLWTKSESFLNNNLKVDWACFDDRHFGGKPCNPPKKCCDLLKNNPKRTTLHEYVADHFTHHEVPQQGGTVAESAIGFALLMGCNPIYLQAIELPAERKNYTHLSSQKADEIIRRTKKLIKKKYITSYIKSKTIHKFFFQWIKKRLYSLFLTIAYKLKLLNKKKFIPTEEKLGVSIVNKNEKSVFYPDLERGLKNIEIYCKMAKKNNVKIINLSKTSNLNKINCLSFLQSNKIF